MNLNHKLSVVKAWYELNNHQFFRNNAELEYKQPIYLIDPVMVNDKGEVDVDKTKNVNLHYWSEVLIPHKLNKTDETLKYHYGSVDKIPNVDYYHDWKLDGGGETYEGAVLNLHKNIIEKFGLFEEE